MRVARAAKFPPNRWYPLLKRLGADALASPTARDLQNADLTNEEISSLLDKDLDTRLDGEFKAARHHGWALLCPDDPRYPPLLELVAVPPPVLTVRGVVDSLSLPSLSVVGTRRPNPYGEGATVQLVGPLAAAGIAIVSGLALGIDGKAHATALAAGGVTVAVCGCGLDRVYPEKHHELAREIVKRGALVSEFSPSMPPLPENFPQRNRIIAGLSHAVLVVQAAAQSGSLHTANDAANEGRPVLVVPGRIGERISDGALKLIRDGGIMVRSPEDILEEIPALAAAVRGRMVTIAAGSGDDLPATASGTARKVFDTIPQSDEIALDDLLDNCVLSTEAVLEGLFELELAGIVEALAGSRYRRTTSMQRYPKGS